MHINIEDKILEKIKNEKIKPTSFWYFLVKDFSLWGAVVLSIAFVSISLAPIIFILENLESDYIKHISKSQLNFYFHILPYPFILFAIIFICIAIFSWRKTKNGYKFEGGKILIVAGILSLILAILLNNLAVGKIIDDNFHDPVFNSYKSIQNRKIENWDRPDLGRLVGKITGVSTSSFELSHNQHTEQIEFDEGTEGKQFINIDAEVRVVGIDVEEKSIDACVILPFENSRSSLKNNSHQHNENFKRNKISEECKKILEIGRANYTKPSTKKI